MEKNAPKQRQRECFFFPLTLLSLSLLLLWQQPLPWYDDFLQHSWSGSSSQHPQNLPRDTRAAGSDNLSLRKESSQERRVVFHLFWPFLYPFVSQSNSSRATIFRRVLLMNLGFLSYYQYPCVHTEPFQHITDPSALFQPGISPTLHCDISKKVALLCPGLVEKIPSTGLHYRVTVARDRWGSVSTERELLHLKENFPYIHKNRIWDVKLDYIKLCAFSPSHPSTLNSSLILLSSFCQQHVKHPHPNKSIRFLREHNELSGAGGVGFHLKHSSTLVHVCAGAWNDSLHVFISCLTQYLCLSLCTGSSEAARGRVCVWVTATLNSQSLWQNIQCCWDVSGGGFGVL